MTITVNQQAVQLLTKLSEELPVQTESEQQLVALTHQVRRQIAKGNRPPNLSLRSYYQGVICKLLLEKISLSESAQKLLTMINRLAHNKELIEVS